MSASYSYSISADPPKFASRHMEQKRSAQDGRKQQQRQRQEQQHQQSSHHLTPDPSRALNHDSARPPSSIYSQSSPVNTAFSPSRSAYQHSQSNHFIPRNADGVSPPSSPDLPPTHAGHTPVDRLERSISPIDRDPVSSLPQAQAFQKSSQDRRAQPANRSNIPTMRRERRHNQEAAARALRESKSRERLQLQQQQQQQQRLDSLNARGYKGGEVRWDPNTGELTNSEKGRPSQVKPAEYAKGLATDPVSPGESHIPAAKPTAASGIATFASRLRRTMHGGGAKAEPHAQPQVEQEPARPPSSPPPVPSPKSPAGLRDLSTSTDPALAAFVSNRPAWQGASGRTTLVAPVHDNKEVPPLNIPRKSSRRVDSSPKLNAGGADSNSPDHSPKIRQIASPPVSPPGVETPSQGSMRSQAVTATTELPPSPHITLQTPPTSRPSGAQAYPSPPLSADPTQDAQQRTSQVRRKPAPTRVLGSHDDSDPFHYNNKAKAQPTLPSQWSSSTLDDQDQSAQRQASTPSRLRPEPITTSPPSIQEPSDSVMDRRRPLCMGHASPRSAKNDAEPVVISLKTPWKSASRSSLHDAANSSNNNSNSNNNSGGGGFGFIDRMRAATAMFASPTDDTASIAGSVFKDLPPAPPETVAKDRIAMFNAQLGDLAHRRMNIDRSIHQMTELMPTDNLLAGADMVQRREIEKRKVEGLRAELSEIQREEYEIGLKLHRAYKRLDDNAEYEPTTLWVRRVTGGG